MNHKFLNFLWIIFILSVVISCSSDDEEATPAVTTFNLTWDNTDADLDIFVTTPEGNTISFSNTSADTGRLDASCDCFGCSAAVETVNFSNASSGNYQYYVDYFGGCSSSSPEVNYTLTVSVGGTTVETQTGTLESGERSNTFIYIK